MQKALDSFLNKLKSNPNVLGVILFGSWARGNQSPDSDIDLVVLQKSGYKRAIEYHGGRAFEIIYVTPKSALSFWASNMNDCVGLWEVAEILYDSASTVNKLKAAVQKLIQKGKQPIGKSQLAQYRFSTEDQLNRAGKLCRTDLTTANLLIQKEAASMTERFFDTKCLWTPAPKQRVQAIKDLSPTFYRLVKQFYAPTGSFAQKLSLVKKMVPLAYSRANRR